MKIAIMQPTYLPWAGYFHMIAHTDLFIFLDDVQYSRKSWQQRNKILLNGQEKFLTVPILSNGKKNQVIHEVRTDTTKLWKKKHLLTLTQTYGKHPFFHEIKGLLETFYQNDMLLLADFNRTLIEEITRLLGIQTKFLKSSDMPVTGRKSEYLVNICGYLGANVYLSAKGSKDYIEQEGLFQQNSIKVIYHDYTPAPYPQKNNQEFISHLSIIDVLANLGIEKTRDYILMELT
jgi:hypothetical protein